MLGGRRAFFISEFADLETNVCCAQKTSAERIVDGDTPTWRHIWSQLNASGWTHKKPPASWIETRWKFIPPGGKANGIEGKDYFWVKIEYALTMSPPKRCARRALQKVDVCYVAMQDDLVCLTFRLLLRMFSSYADEH
ncbi:hypothetical protein GN244_ATG18865 [Phytophthora infestans]|uniref:Uncharacterized protein n=1 Tax=Phytophthora infestans TaxID=4787 RepID=A0A833SF46_PHYIN|nr:hypothetical protein GN244_ATG18865 [Phytophthora infestans]